LLLLGLQHALAAALFSCASHSVRRTVNVTSAPVELFTHGYSLYSPPPGVRLPPATLPGGAYDQFLHALALDRTQAPPPPSSALLEYSISPSASHTWAFALRGAPGSSFAVTLETAEGALASCAAADGFDGTHTLRCPRPPGGRARLSVRLTHLDYGAFLPYGAAAVVQQALSEELFDCQVAEGDGAAAADCFPAPGGWWLAARSASPAHVSDPGCLASAAPPPPPPPPDLVACAARTPGLYLFGESHSRFQYDLLLERLGLAEGKGLELKHSDDDAGRLHFRAAHYVQPGPEGGVLLDALEAAAPFPPGAALLISFGSWQLHGKGLLQSILDVQVLAPRLRSLLASDPGLRISFVSAPAVHRQEGPFAGVQTSPAHAALVEAAAALLPREVRLVDMVSASRPFLEATPALDWDCWDDALCGCHMLCRLTWKGVQNISGRFGLVLFDELMRDVCGESR